MKLEIAQQVTAIINKLLSGTDVCHVSVRSDGWPDVHIGPFNKAYAVDYNNGDGSVGLSAAGWVMSGSEHWHIDADHRTLSAKTTNGFGQPLVFAWTDMRPRDDTWNAWHEAEQAMPYIG